MTKIQKAWSVISLLCLATLTLWVFFLRDGSVLSSAVNFPVMLLIALATVSETERLTLGATAKHERITYSLLEISLIVGVLFVDPKYMLLAPMATISVYYWHRKLPLIKSAFNAANMSLRYASTWTLLSFFPTLDLISPLGWAAIGTAAVATSVMEHLALRMVVASMGGKNDALLFVTNCYMSLIPATQGVILALLLSVNPAAIVLFAMSIFIHVAGGKSHEETTSLAETDSLTGLSNRYGFETRLDTITTADLSGIAFIDLDNFKSVNDSYGHDAGNKVLSIIANRITETIRESDFASRSGGDEFIVAFSSDTDPIKATDRLRVALNEPIVVGSQIMPTGASVGLAVTENDDSIIELTRRADISMYDLKRQRKESIVA